MSSVHIDIEGFKGCLGREDRRLKRIAFEWLRTEFPTRLESHEEDYGETACFIKLQRK